MLSAYDFNISEFQSLVYFILAVIASGLTGSSRLILDAHTEGQIYSGYLVGISIMAACLVLY